MTPTDVLVLNRPEQLTIATHPLRLEIIEWLQREGPESIAELASALERRPNALTYHVRLLERAGIVVRTGTRKAGPRDEAVFGLARARVAFAMSGSSRALRAAAIRTATAVLRMAERELRRAIEREGLPAHADFARPLGRRQKTWLTEDELAEAHRRLANLDRFLERCHRRKRGRPYTLTAVLVPTAPKGNG